MNFFERQQHVRRMSARLVLLFTVAVFGIVLVIDLAVAFAFNAFTKQPVELAGVLIATSIITLLAIGLAAAFRMIGLRGGGGRVARELGGVLVPADTQDPQLRRLRNVVEEIAIASGTPVPEIYLMPHEESINAFAAGWSTSDAAVAVTRGTLERLNRDELQGVIAHEFSHVVNGDMRLNIRLMGLLFGILFLTVLGNQFARVGVFSGGGRRDNRDGGGNPLVIVGIALLAAGFIGVFVGRIIKASVSRQREYLADASAVQFTRQTDGIAGALKKIAGLPAGSKINNPRGEEVGHMLFGAGARFSSLFATHPPLLERIKVLEPSFDPAQLQQLSQRWAASPPSGLAEDAALGLTASAGTAVPAADATVSAAEDSVVGGIGAPDANAFDKASALLGQIPDEILDRARSADSVVPLVLGLLLADDPQARQAQHAALASRQGAPLADAVLAEAQTLDGLHPLLRLPLAEVALPALRQLPETTRAAMPSVVTNLIHADGRITAYEYCLSRLVYSELDDAMRPKPTWRDGRYRVADVPGAVATLLAILAQSGHDDAGAAGRAFAAGLARTLPNARLPYAPPEQGVVALESAWPSLIDLRPEDKQLLVAGAVAVISDDGVTTVTELELLRTMCAILHCPLPL
jgi:Zn-dependent protease with chaperone function